MPVPLVGFLGAFLLGLLQNAVPRVLAALGFGVLSYAALKTGFDTLASYFDSAQYSIPSGIVAMAKISGISTSINMCLSAAFSKIALITSIRGTEALVGSKLHL